jgi:hypothetical protein
VPKLRASGSVRQPSLGQKLSPSSTKPGCSSSAFFSEPGHYPLALRAPSIKPSHCRSGPPPSKSGYHPSGSSYRNYPPVLIAFGNSNHHSSVPSFFRKPIRRPSDPPFSKPNHESLAVNVSKPNHLATISLPKASTPLSSSEPHGRPLISPSKSDPQPSTSISVASSSSSSRHVHSFRKPGFKALVPSSPSQSDIRDTMSIRKDMPVVSCSALTKLAMQ